MQRYFIKLAYNGASYHGWQLQNNAPSVQGAITRGLELLTRQSINLVGCGRTDTGVHAREYFAHFELASEMDPGEMDQLSFRLNRFLPEDITIYWVKKVESGMHARFSAVSRTYLYYIHNYKDPFLNDRSWFVHEPLDLDAMNEGARLLMGYDDFTSFSKLHSAAKTNICHISAASWSLSGSQLRFEITADRFLRNMVRAIVGTLVELGQGKISLDQLKDIIEAKNRSEAGQSVPAHGLFLEKVVYPLGF